MDPGTALVDALEALNRGDIEAAVIHLDDYADWRRGGGVEPTFQHRHCNFMLGDALAQALNDALTLSLAVKEAA